MKRYLFPLLLLLLALPPLSYAQEDGVLTVSFDEPFLPGWELNNARVINGILAIEPNGFAVLTGEMDPISIAVDIRLIAEGEFVLTYNASEGRGYHIVVGRDFILLQKEQPASLAELAGAAPIPIPHEAWITLEVARDGNNHEVFLNREKVLEAVDNEPLPPGALAFETLGDLGAEMDNLVLHGGGIPLAPPETSPGEPQEDGLAWIRTGGPLGGLGYDVRMHPNNPDIMFVTDAWAGVFKSTDGGATWQPSNSGITVRSGPSGDAIPVFCLTIDPNNPDIIWAGMSGVRGIFKSTDGGETWTQMDNGVVEFEGITFRGFGVRPGDSQTVYAAAEISSWVWSGSEQLGREFDRTQGVVYKTTDGGQNWTPVWRGDNLARYVLIDPRNPDIVYVSTGIFDREAANSDHLTNTPGGVGVLKSTDGGQTWAQINNGLTNLYIGTLFMHPTNPDILLAGADNITFGEGSGVYLSTNGGAQWQKVLDEGVQSVEFASSNPQIAYAGNPGAVFRSEDGGLTWQRASSDQADWGPPGRTHRAPPISVS